MRSIFVVDDSPANIELATIAIEIAGLKASISSATDGQSALRMLRNTQELPHLILLDLKMSGMSGIEVLSEIRADKRLREIPVVVVSSSRLESDRTEALAAGANDYLEKPFELDQFSKDLDFVIHRWLPN